MAPIVHCSGGNISLFPRTTFIPRKDIQLMKHDVPGSYMRPTSYCERLQLTQSSLRLFQIYRGGCGSKHGSRVRIVAAVGTDVAVEELSPDVSGKGADETSDGSDSLETSETAAPTPAVATTTTTRNKRLRPGRKSEMAPVKDEELVPGASFTGKVRSVQPFGAFIDIGAYTDGLVHVSRLSDGFVKDVGDVVSVGQEVKVYIVEINKENGRISLTMLEGDDGSKTQQRKSPTTGSSDPRPTRKNSERSNQKRGDVQKTSKFVKGQVLDGTVKKLTRAGAFVSLPDGEEGFLPVSEESEGFGNILGNSSLTVGQEVNVRVLRFTRGKATLTMKKEEDIEGLNKQLSQGSVHVATNPFELAFRKNKGISSFLEERERLQKASENLTASKTSEQIVEEVDKIITKTDTLEVDGLVVGSDDDPIDVSSVAGVVLEDGKTTSQELHEETLSVDPVVTELVSSKEEPATTLGQNGNAALETSPEDEESSEIVTESLPDSGVDKVPIQDDITASITEETSIKDKDKEAGESSSAAEENEEVPVSDSSDSVTAEESNVDAQSPEETRDQVLSSKSAVVEGVAAGQSDTTATEPMAETPTLLENEAASSKSEEVDVKIPEAVNEQDGNPDKGSTGAAATISPVLVKQLRDETGAGMMDCKKALSESGGDIIKAQEFLRKKGLASADKKASRATAEGRVGSYIHDSRIGILIEVNCETDFVSRGEIFKELVDDLAMQVAACPQVRYLATEDVPEDFVNKEREIEMQKEDLLKKPEEIRSKIVDGRIRKRLEEFALLEQPYIKNDKLTVKDMVKQTIATIGENIKVKRFVRYNLGEGLEKKSQDFAAEVAAQTAAKSSPAPPKDESTETKGIVEKPPTIAVSAALVKQLRDETGAGMMDCKKALAETGGDLEQAQEYLRKKGLSSADKKSARLAAEGRISSYIHDSRIGILIEVNSETDFVARNERFKELVDDLAMQVVACPQVEYVSVEDIPESIVNAEKEIEMQREDLKSKPENIREKIVEGRISKRLGEISLLEQPFIKDDNLMVKDLVKQTVAALGENIKVRRFVRYTLGENME